MASVSSQGVAEVPKLVVYITIDQLRGDYLQYFGHTFGEKGFKKLFNEGLVYHHTRFDFPQLSQAASTASLHTGANPSYHGIVGDKKYDFEEKREVSIIYDPAYMGNYTSETFSPLPLQTTTLGDELKLASDGRSDVYSIAHDANAAILSAGTLANAAFWIDDYNGKWATSTFYKNVPWYVDRHNTSEGLSNKANNETWTPAHLAQYTAFPYSKDTKDFKYSFDKNDKNKFHRIKSSPYVNTEITNLFAKFIQFADLGKRTNPDMLSISYYAGNYAEVADKDFSLEIQDTYARLDKEIERLLDLIEKNVGIKHTLIVLTSTGYFDSSTNNTGLLKPKGEFFPKRCTALLNMYLMAIYGHGNWVEGYYNEQIYFNRKLIETAKIDFNDLQQKSAEFVAQFSGVQNVTTFGQLLFDTRDEGNQAFRNGMYKKISGDLYLELQPGWMIMDEQNKQQIKPIRNNAILTPAVFYGNNLPRADIFRQVKANGIAATIAHVLRIRPPNACKEEPFSEFLKMSNKQKTE